MTETQTDEDVIVNGEDSVQPIFAINRSGRRALERELKKKYSKPVVPRPDVGPILPSRPRPPPGTPVGAPPSAWQQTAAEPANSAWLKAAMQDLYLYQACHEQGLSAAEAMKVVAQIKAESVTDIASKANVLAIESKQP